MIILKKVLALLLGLLLCITAFAGCSSSGDKLEVTGITDEILAYTDDGIVWVELNKDELTGYFGFAVDNVAEHSAYINDAEEKYDIVSAFEFESNEAMRSAIEQLNISLDAATKNFKAVSDSESLKIMNRIILSKDNILVVVVSSNNTKIKEMLSVKGFAPVV